jgi:catechol 2,3-dioxygenase-like lactoylglutathione lyase family enzyme
MAAFAITTQPEEATSFYGEKLGFRFRKDDGFALVFDANGTMLRVSKLKQFTPPQFTAPGWQVEDIVAAVEWFAGEGSVLRTVCGNAAG